MRSFTTLKTRLLAFLLALTAILTSFPLSVIAEGITPEENSTPPKTEEQDAPNVSVLVLHNGAQKTSITLDEYGREFLTAKIHGTTSTKRSWQILDPLSNTWVSIAGKSQETLSVNYSLVHSMLNEKGKAYLRLRVQDGDNYFVSEPVEIAISYATPTKRSAAKLAASPVPKEQSTSTAFAASYPKFSLLAEQEEPFKTYSIVINYIFDDGSLAFEPYGATVAAGSEFILDIPSPTVIGYEPFRRVGEVYEDASVVSFNYASVQENITVNVIYEPAIVEFQVHHHFQDLIDDSYSLHADRITIGKGLTGSLVPEGLALSELELPGFKALDYEFLTIAADGSTVVEIRYDRNYYLVNFDMQGGFGTEPVYTRYGSSVGANVPTRPGYLFDGWELVAYGVETPSAEQRAEYDINNKVITLPDRNLTYRARWITQVTNYTMVFWKENIDDNGFSYWGYLDNLQAMSGSFVSGSDRIREVAGIDDENYFTYCDPLTDKNVMVEGDGSTIVNVYYTRNRYSITFKAPGLCSIPEGHVHGDDCYDAFCKGGHIHDDNCERQLICEALEHTEHTADCVICGYEEHMHSGACCGYEEHTHVKNCYRNVGNTANPSNAPKNVEDGYIYVTGTGWRRYYYICISNTWYTYNGTNVSNGDILNPTCGKVAHTHGTISCSCEKIAHLHSDSCYRDILHTHGDSCYRYSCGMEEHIHSDACKVLNCGIPVGHTHSSTCTRTSSTNTVKIVYKKYQQNLGKDSDNLDSPEDGIWPIVDDNGKIYNSGQRWKPSGSSTYTQVLVYLANMPGESFTLTLDTSSNDTYTMNYYLEVLPGQPYTKEYGGRYYVLYTTVKANYNYLTEAEDFFDIKGFDQAASNPAYSNGQIDINRGGTVDMYYTRQVDHLLEFSSNGEVLEDKTQYGIPYGLSLKDYYFEPDYPDSLEPNAFVFGGWYTSPGCFDGTEVNWETITMEAGGLLLYAKWSPVTHTVDVYLDDTLGEQIGATQYVPHGNFAQAPTETISNGNYIFQGWFYKQTEKDGTVVEKAFVFTGIPVIQDLKIYAKWSSHVTVNYTINYVLQSTGEPIADPTVGSAIAGHNKTFYAKAGNELDAGYREGYYPLTNSHTVTMSAEADHEFTFEYVFVESMPYLVRYLDEDGNPVHEEKKVLDNNLSVVTETFARKDGMMPDAYQKRLILSATSGDEDQDGILDCNVITFYYANDTEHAYYRVVHYIENIAGDGYREYRSEEAVGIIGQTYTFTPITMTGFSLNHQKTTINGVSSPSNGEISAELTSNGLLVELYYDRQTVTYTVNYLEQGTDRILYEQKIGHGIFGEQALEYAVGLTHLGYTLVGENTKQLHLSTNPDLNVINFYYQETIYSIKYQIIGMEGAGILSITSENILAVSGQPTGSTPMISDGYHFVGWYLDAACTHPVDESWVDPQTYNIHPSKTGVWTENKTYYAKIDPDFTTLTIQATGAQDVDVGQVFLFHIRGISAGTENVDLTVMVVGNASVTIANLRIGSYTVTEITDWSYRYQPDSVSKSLTLSVQSTANVLTFSHARIEDKWLDGNDTQNNLYH